MCKFFRNLRRLSKMQQELDALTVAVNDLKVNVGEAIGEIHSLADQLAAHAGEDAKVVDLTNQIKAQADVLHVAVFPPSAAV